MKAQTSQMLKTLLQLSIFFTTAVTFWACSPKQNDSFESEVQSNTIELAKDEGRGNSTSGGGGEPQYMSPEEVEEFMKTRIHRLYAENFLPLRTILFQILSSIDYKINTLHGEGVSEAEIAFIRRHRETLEVKTTVAGGINLPVHGLNSFDHFSALPKLKLALEKLKSLNQENGGVPYLKDCQSHYPDFQNHKYAWFSKGIDGQSPGMCFESEKIQMDNANKDLLFTSLYFHEFTHFLLADAGLDHEEEEKIAQEHQKMFFDYYSQNSRGNSILHEGTQPHIRFVKTLDNVITSSKFFCSHPEHNSFILGFAQGIGFLASQNNLSLGEIYNDDVFDKFHVLTGFVDFMDELAIRDGAYRRRIADRLKIDGNLCEDPSTEEQVTGFATDMHRVFQGLKIQEKNQ